MPDDPFAKRDEAEPHGDLTADLGPDLTRPQHDENTIAHDYGPTPNDNALQIRCPHCHTAAVVAVDSRLVDIECSSCGSVYSLVDDKNETRAASTLSQVGHFELIERLGVGGFGSVWKARDTNLDRAVAVKIPRQGQMSGEEMEKFLREARAAAQLHHPNIVSVHEVGRDGETVYIVSDLIRGITLGDWLTGQTTNSREAAELALKIAEALHHAHEKGVIHRDLKPANVMIDGNGEPHLMDFGLARREVGDITMTMDGQVLGTPAYMSPEQAEGESHKADRRSDVYSLGVVLFRLLTGELPFRGNARMLVHQVINDEPPSPRKLNSIVPKDLETITLKCLEKSPERRYETAEHVAKELRKFLDGEPIQARPVSGLERGWRWAKRKPALAALAAAVMLAMATGTAVSSYFAIAANKSARETRNALGRIEIEKNRAEENARLAELRLQVAQQRTYSDQMARVGKTWQTLPGQALAWLEDQDACPPQLREFAWNYFHQRLDPKATTFTGHQGQVSSVDYAPDEKHIATGSFDKTVRIWNVENSEGVVVLEGHAGPVTCVRYSPDGSLLASASHDESVKLWDCATGELVRTLKDESRTEDGGLGSVAFSPNGKLVAAASSDKTIKLWKLATGELIRSFKGHTNWVWSVDFSPNGDLLASGSRDGAAVLWNVQTGKRVHTFPQSGEAFYVGFSPDGRHLAVSDFFGMLRLFDVEEKKEVWKADSGNLGSQTFDFAPDGSSLATANADQTVRLLDVATGETLRVIPLHSSAVSSVAFSKSGERLASASKDLAVKIWSLDEKPRAYSLHEGKRPVRQMEYSPDGKWVARIERESNTIQLCDSATGWMKQTLRVPQSEVYCVAFANDGKTIAAGYEGGVTLWELPSGRIRNEFHKDIGSTVAIAFSPDDKTLATSDDFYRIDLWELPTLKSQQRIELPPLSRTFDLEFSPDGKRLAIGGFYDDNGKTSELIVWDISKKKSVFQLSGHQASLVLSLSFSPDGRTLATAGQDSAVCLWDASSGKLRERLLGHSGIVRTIRFSPDGRTLASGSYDRNLHLWDPITGELWGTLSGHEDAVAWLTFSPDGQTLASGAFDGAIRLWEAASLTPEKQMKRNATALVRNMFKHELTREEALASIASEYADDQALRNAALSVIDSGWEQLLRQQASEIVERLFTSIPSSQSLIESLEQDENMSDELRSIAIGFAELKESQETADHYNECSWAIVRLNEQPDAQYQAALSWAQSAVARAFTNGNYRNTLGVAYFRTGKFEKAIATLKFADWLKPGEPLNYGYLALASHHLDRQEQASLWWHRWRAALVGSGSRTISESNINLYEMIHAAFLSSTTPEALWRVSQYDWSNREYKKRPANWNELVSTTPFRQQEVKRLAFPWKLDPVAPDMPSDFFATEARTTLKLDGGVYELTTIADDGIRVLVDSKQVLSDWNLQRKINSLIIEVPAGKHEFVVEHFEREEAAHLFFDLYPLHSTNPSVAFRVQEVTPNVAELSSKVGEEVEVFLRVASVGSTTDLLFLNSLRQYQDKHCFTAVIPSSLSRSLHQVTGGKKLRDLIGRKVRCQGVIKQYKNRLQIEVQDPLKQLELLPEKPTDLGNTS